MVISSYFTLLKCESLSRIHLSVTSWTVACQAPLSVGFPRQEYWSGLPFPSPGDLPDPGIKSEFPTYPTLQVDSLQLSHIHHYTSVPTHRLYNTKSEPYCKLWTLGEYDVLIYLW